MELEKKLCEALGNGEGGEGVLLKSKVRLA